MQVSNANILKPKGCCVMQLLTNSQIIAKQDDPYFLLDIFITSSHHRMTCIPLLIFCYVLSVPLIPSYLSVYK